ncbi:MAG: hypothetical protein RLP44_32760 [Aggregatilineales bacterium]
MRRTLIALLLIIMLITIAACGGDSDDDTTTDTDTTQSTAPENPEAVSAVERYLQAKVDGDEDGIRENICAEMESDIRLEATSFASVDASLEEMSCSFIGTGANGELVTCTGQITALYGAESRSFPLSTYRVVEEDGEWRWCGEAEATQG